MTGHAPDGWATPVTYASLQVLEQAIEKAGTLDRKKVLDTIANGGPWNTVIGQIDLKTHVRENQWGMGQWQDGQFVGVSPSAMPGRSLSYSPSRRGERRLLRAAARAALRAAAREGSWRRTAGPACPDRLF